MRTDLRSFTRSPSIRSRMSSASAFIAGALVLSFPEATRGRVRQCAGIGGKPRWKCVSASTRKLKNDAVLGLPYSQSHAASMPSSSARESSPSTLMDSRHERFGGGGISSSEVLGLGRADGPWLGASCAASGMGADIWTSGLRWPSGVHDEIVMRKMACARKGFAVVRTHN